MDAVIWSSRVYRLLVRAYPAGFRAKYGDEMVWCFEDLCTAALRKNGVWGLVKLWLRVLPDWLVTLVNTYRQSQGDMMNTTQFNHQFTSTLALFTRALRGGYNVKQAFELIVQHAPEPTKSTFQRMLDEVNGGKNWLEAFTQVSSSISSPYFTHVTAEMKQQLAEGGNLADRIDAVNRDIFKEVGDTGWAKLVDLGDGYDVQAQYPLN
jgi:Flp pilus assembly protein TadB